MPTSACAVTGSTRCARGGGHAGGAVALHPVGPGGVSRSAWAAAGGSLGGRSAGMVVVVAVASGFRASSRTGGCLICWTHEASRLGLLGTDRLTKHSTAGVDAFIVFAVLVVGLTLTRDPRAMLGRFVVLGIYPMLCGFGYLGGRPPSAPIGVFFLAGGVGMVVLVVARARRGGACESCGRSAMPDRRAPWDGGHCQRQGAR